MTDITAKLDVLEAISLWQPWASLWCSERKLHETRHWPTRHRGWLLVHAAKKFVRDIPYDDELHKILDDEFGGHWGMDLPTGAIIGRVKIIGCCRTEDIYAPRGNHADIDDWHCGDFSEGRYGWRRGEFEVFKNPIPYRGQQGMFKVPLSSVLDTTEAAGG